MKALLHRRFWIIPALIITAGLTTAGVLHNTARSIAAATVVVPQEMPPARVCVTRKSFCPIGLVRASDPCSCPDTLDGNVPGYVKLVDGQSTMTTSQAWPDRDGIDLLVNLGS